MIAITLTKRTDHRFVWWRRAQTHEIQHTFPIFTCDLWLRKKFQHLYIYHFEILLLEICAPHSLTTDSGHRATFFSKRANERWCGFIFSAILLVTLFVLYLSFSLYVCVSLSGWYAFLSIITGLSKWIPYNRSILHAFAIC